MRGSHSRCRISQESWQKPTA